MRRLTAKCAARYACEKLQDFLSCRPVLASVFDNMTADDVVVKLDISNAFNSLHRDYMLRCVAERIPEIYKFCYSSYIVQSLAKNSRWNLKKIDNQMDFIRKCSVKRAHSKEKSLQKSSLGICNLRQICRNFLT